MLGLTDGCQMPRTMLSKSQFRGAAVDMSSRVFNSKMCVFSLARKLDTNWRCDYNSVVSPDVGSLFQNLTQIIVKCSF